MLSFEPEVRDEIIIRRLMTSQRSEHITGQYCTHGTVIISSVLSAQERQSSFFPFCHTWICEYPIDFLCDTPALNSEMDPWTPNDHECGS